MSTKNIPDAAVTTEAEVLYATEDQIGHILEMWKRRLKNRKLTRVEAQAIITNGGSYLSYMDQAADLLVDQVRTNLSKMIIRLVKVDRNRTPQEVLDATKRIPEIPETNNYVVAAMPRGFGDEVEVLFFQLDYAASDAQLVKEYERRGLKPDPYAQAAVNEADLGFANEYPNATRWGLDREENYNFLTFNDYGGLRYVSCGYRGNYWDRRWWFAGVRK